MPEIPDDCLSRAVAIPPVPQGVGRARAWVRATLGRWQLTQLAESVELATSELVSNAVKHAHGEEPVPVLLAYAAGTLRLEVRDGDPLNLPALAVPMPTAGSGYGLLLVQTYSDRWGVRQMARGKAVWCEFDITQHRCHLHAVPSSGDGDGS
jgi:anti-sigma regulatory factor (Ser/Thr protein kinase)